MKSTFAVGLPREKDVGVAPTLTRSFRPDIEGLRAVAVVAVLLYHLKVSAVPGGFIGVDMFFVISGYLMATIIIGDVAKGRFYMRRFLIRRVLRIWPALSVLLLAALTAGIFMLPPDQLADLGKEVLSSFFLANNVTLWTQIGYFAPSAESIPLLHLWSIAVEQQFYLLVPVLMLAALSKPGADRRWLIVSILIGSFALSAVLTSARPALSFYILPTRIWEFLLGSLVALYDINPAGRLLSETLTGVGSLLIILSALYFQGTMRFPGYVALLPCIGTVLLIHGNTGSSTLTGSVLSSGPFVLVGTLSYSLYLWHWPLIAFARLRGATVEALEIRILIVITASVFAYLSWRFVETPFRPLESMSHKVRWPALGVAALAAALFGTVTTATEGLPFRLDAATRSLLRYQNYPERAALYREGECFLRIGQPVADFRVGTCSDWIAGTTKLLLWGDSHAAHYAFGLKEGGRKADLTFLQATYAGCAPVPLHIGLSRSCAAFGKYVSELASSGDVDAIVISANWTGYSEILPELRTMVQRLASTGHFVVVIGPSIEFDRALPLLLAARQSGTKPAPPVRTWIVERAVRTDALMAEEFNGLANVFYVSPIAETCLEFVCPVELANRVPLTWDSTHLTAGGSVLVSSRLLEKLVPALRSYLARADR